MCQIELFSLDLPIVPIPMAIGTRRAVASQLSKIFWLSLRFARDDEPPIFMGVQRYEPYNSQPKLFRSF